MLSTTEPQSIIHHALRFERRMLRSVTNMNRRPRRLLQSALDCSRSVLMKKTPSADDPSKASAPGSRSIMSTSCHSAQTDHEEYYETINQNDFMTDCMMNSTGQFIFVHFFINESSVSKAIDTQIRSLASMDNNKRTFVRINAELAPFVISKLHISKEQPTVLAMRNGSVLNRICDFSSEKDCEELNIWASTIELIQF
jgi:hypothetical protein